MDFTIKTQLLLFLTATGAGWVDTIAGGGGLITIPALLLAGMPPPVALATNKLQGSSGTLVASIYFLRRGVFKLKENRLLLLMAFLGAFCGTGMLLSIKVSVLRAIIPILLIAIGLYFLLSPTGDIEGKSRLSPQSFALLFAPILGFYDGFFGPGTGMFMALAFVSLRGYNLSQATAHAKVLNFTSNFSALLYFLLFGEINWGVGSIMIIGQIIGASIAARMVLTKGAALIRPVVITVCFLMSAKLLLNL